MCAASLQTSLFERERARSRIYIYMCLRRVCVEGDALRESCVCVNARARREIVVLHHTLKVEAQPTNIRVRERERDQNSNHRLRRIFIHLSLSLSWAAYCE